jgi:hypothetical protein
VAHRLIVTNGAAAAEAIRATGVAGEVCAWNDVLTDGPVPGSLDDSALARVRAQFIADRGWGTVEEIHLWFSERDAQLEAAPNFPEVVLWFEHDLYDQLQLIQILARLANGRSNVSLIQHRRFIGRSTVEELKTDFKSRTPATQAQFGSATMAWAAFRSSTPAAVDALLASGRTEPLPFLAPALRRWCSTFPDPERGLSRTERRTLELVVAGTCSPADLFRKTSDEEEAAFRGDASYHVLLKELSSGPRPLLRTTSGLPLDPNAVSDALLAITDDGKGVLAGSLDRIEIGGIDAWRGGIHLTTASHWRWSSTTGFERSEVG